MVHLGSFSVTYERCDSSYTR